jgi:hypothetical protein
MKRMFLGIVVCAVLILCSSGSTIGKLTVEYIDGDKVVYDETNGLYWYPYLTDTIQMTRDEQQVYMVLLNCRAYANIIDWKFATLDQMSGLKDSMAEVAQHLEWLPMGPPGGPSTPRLVWPVDDPTVDQFFTPTGVITFPPVFGNMPIQIYNGRTADWWGLRRDPDDTIEVRFGEAADHFWVHSMRTPGQFATLMYNYDQHYIPDDDTMHDIFGGVECGAWLVSERGPWNSWFDFDWWW